MGASGVVSKRQVLSQIAISINKLVINIEKPWRKLLVMQLDGSDCKCKSIQSNEETQRSVQESSALR
jgi:hypothetical protein